MARLLRTWGNRGELCAEPLGRAAEGFSGVPEVWVLRAPGAALPLELESVREQRGRLLFKFRGVDSIGAAEALVGAEVGLPLGERRRLPPGEYFQSDLIGCEVLERPGGRRVGVVTGWQEFGAVPLLEVDAGDSGEPLLVPFARAICVQVDLAARRIEVELPPGLKELNG